MNLEFKNLFFITILFHKFNIIPMEKPLNVEFVSPIILAIIYSVYNKYNLLHEISKSKFLVGYDNNLLPENAVNLEGTMLLECDKGFLSMIGYIDDNKDQEVIILSPALQKLIKFSEIKKINRVFYAKTKTMVNFELLQILGKRNYSNFSHTNKEQDLLNDQSTRFALEKMHIDELVLMHNDLMRSNSTWTGNISLLNHIRNELDQRTIILD